MTGHEFADRVAEALGVDPLTPAEANELLAIAGVAAHASERLAAPLTTYLAGRAGASLDDVRSVVKALSADA